MVSGAVDASERQTSSQMPGKHGFLGAVDPGEVLPWLPCSLALEVAVVGFTVGTLLKLSQGYVVKTTCHQSTDIPLYVNGIQMAWTEFEVVGERLAARITDLV